MKEFIEISKKQIEDNNIGDNYCVLVFIQKRISRIYKSISDFESKINEHIKDKDPIFSIDFQIWIFD